MKKRLFPAMLLAGLAAAPLSAQTPATFSDTYSDFVETLRARCTGFENGAFDAPAEAISRTTDFNGDGITDPIVEEWRFSCSSSATMFNGGTGGSYVHLFVSQPDGGYSRFEFLAYATLIVTPQGRANRPVLLLPEHGANCDVTAEPCYAAYVWSETGRFVSPGGVVEASQ
ncbi:hypothetical protein [Celeribacter persicus]|uniref:Uncharacterized protein n=1 Tax=Celeribacter persicus TaxID=1651082 RepID=A0A2T5HIG9_9RHOB|nr:hypothetical protein [Celeribacter persicus]PTQ71364.1 hypothetical protein C8N42_108142 [Celeribacter persicus]